jgi:glutamine amidotransferase PdxT
LLGTEIGPLALAVDQQRIEWQVENLKLMIAKLKRDQYGRSSERQLFRVRDEVRARDAAASVVIRAP